MESTPTKSKRTFSESNISPQESDIKRNKFNMEESIRNLTAEITKLTKEVSELKQSSETTNTTVTDIQSKLDGNCDITVEFQEMKSEMQSLKRENKALKQQLMNINEKIADLEYHQKRNNLIFEGFAESKDESNLDCYQKLIDMLSGYLDVSGMRIARCH